MEVERRRHREHDRKRRPSQQRVPYPPFNAGALRLSAIDHLESYKELFNDRTGGPRKLILDKAHESHSNESECSNDLIRRDQDVAFPTVESDINAALTMRRKTIQGFLLVDLTRILQAVRALRKILKDGRTQSWLVGGTIAASGHMLPTLVAPLVTYPIAAYQVGKHEYTLHLATVLLGEVEALFRIVQTGAVVRSEDAYWLHEHEWSRIPWGKIEPEILYESK